MRPISNTDLYMIANYLEGTDKDLFIGLSELGYNPNLYSEEEMLYWLSNELSIFIAEDGIWYRRN